MVTMGNEKRRKVKMLLGTGKLLESMGAMQKKSSGRNFGSLGAAEDARGAAAAACAREWGRVGWRCRPTQSVRVAGSQTVSAIWPFRGGKECGRLGLC